MKRLTAIYGSRRIDFQLEHRAVRSLAITVHPNGAVKVVAPLEAEENRIVSRVSKRAKWIVKQWERQATYLPKPPPRQHHTGESIRYLGRQYRLRVVKLEASHRRQIVLSRATIEVRLENPRDGEAVGKIVSNWLRVRAAEVLSQRFAACAKTAKQHGVGAGKLVLRSMSKRWGSCVKGGLILINPELVRAAVDCIDYVILHELCHRKIHSHSAAFYRLLCAVLPDWTLRKAKLEKTEP